jgi:hypothetical protein
MEGAGAYLGRLETAPDGLLPRNDFGLSREGLAMTLTRTRTRTQTALTKLAEMVANVHGELAFLEGLLANAEPARGLTPEARVRLQSRHQKLIADREALFATLRRFDPSIAPENIGTSDEWQKQFGRRTFQMAAFTARYKSQFQADGK